MLPFDFSEFLLLAEQTINQPRDLLVAIVAIGLGLNIVYTAIYNSERCFQSSTVQMLERNFGRENARIILVGLGLLCVFLGFYLVAQTTIRRTVSENLNAEQGLESRSAARLVHIR